MRATWFVTFSSERALVGTLWRHHSSGGVPGLMVFSQFPLSFSSLFLPLGLIVI